MKSNDLDGWEVWLLWALVFSALWLSDWNPLAKESTVYAAVCLSEVRSGTCPAKDWGPWQRVNYRPERETKTVVYWIDGEPPSKYDNCAIVDEETWSCFSGGSSYQMVKGILSDLPRDGAYMKSVPKWQWWWLKFKKM
jgi:hypothetical protein